MSSKDESVHDILELLNSFNHTDKPLSVLLTNKNSLISEKNIRKIIIIKNNINKKLQQSDNRYGFHTIKLKSENLKRKREESKCSSKNSKQNKNELQSLTSMFSLLYL
jgi:UDP-N-acetylenolpyruvoylglucosamine reductase